MATVIPFEERAVAHLRERLGAAEEANEDLIAFARGHSGAVASIHSAVLAAIESDGVDGLLHVVTQEWPLILGIDAVALSLIVGDRGFRADGSGVQHVDPKILRRAIGQVDGVEMRTVERGHPLFGPACELIRAEAMVCIQCEPPLPFGLDQGGNFPAQGGVGDTDETPRLHQANRGGAMRGMQEAQQGGLVDRSPRNEVPHVAARGDEAVEALLLIR